MCTERSFYDNQFSAEPISWLGGEGRGTIKNKAFPNIDACYSKAKTLVAAHRSADADISPIPHSFSPTL
jgi:hypothetical protein